MNKMACKFPFIETTKANEIYAYVNQHVFFETSACHTRSSFGAILV